MTISKIRPTATMDKITPEAVAAHAEAWPCLGGGLWRVEREGKQPTLLVLSVNDGLIMLWTEILGWQRTDPQPGWTITPVRPDGSDLPDVEIHKRWAKESAEAIAEAYDCGRADERRRCAEIDEETGNAERRAALLQLEYERGRAEERAAIVAGLTARVEDMEASITPLTQPESRRNLDSQANELSNVIVFLKSGEWGAKP